VSKKREAAEQTVSRARIGGLGTCFESAAKIAIASYRWKIIQGLFYEYILDPSRLFTRDSDALLAGAGGRVDRSIY
jgi:hypothetical protein